MNRSNLVLKSKFFLFSLLTLMLFSTAAVAQKTRGKDSRNKENSTAIHKVVMQLSSGDTAVHRGLINNLRNLKAGWGDSVQIEVVVHGPGINLVHQDRSTQQKEIQEMIDKGIRVVVCKNTMTQKNVPAEKLLPRIDIVPRGVGEIIKKQEQGWSYIKVGS